MIYSYPDKQSLIRMRLKRKRTLPFMNSASLERERGALLTLLMKSLLRITASNLLPVLLTKNRYSYRKEKISLNQSDITIQPTNH